MVDASSTKASQNAEAYEPEKWGNDGQYWLASIGYMIGFGNFWRFPSLMYNNGGWAFFVPYIFSLLLIGIPLWLIETSFGQLIDCRLHARWGTLKPRLWAVSIAQTIICFFYATYYVTLIVWSLSYFFDSMKRPLPWLIDGSMEAETKDELYNDEYFAVQVTQMSQAND